MYNDFFIATFSLSSCLIAGAVSANHIPNIQASPTSNLSSASFVTLHSLSSSSPLNLTQRPSPSPSPSPTSTPHNNLPEEREKCRRDFQGKEGEISFCEGKVLFKYNRQDDAIARLKEARDAFLRKGKSDKARDVEAWAAQNGISLSSN
jgi:hypothetical protein